MNMNIIVKSVTAYILIAMIVFIAFKQTEHFTLNERPFYVHLPKRFKVTVRLLALVVWPIFVVMEIVRLLFLAISFVYKEIME